MALDTRSHCSILLPLRFPLWSARLRTLGLLTLLTAALLFQQGCGVSASSGLASSLQSNQAATSTGVVTPHFFDMVVKSAAHQPGIVTGGRRLWDSGVTWAALEPAPGRFVWTTLDAEVSAAQAAGAEVTLTLGMTPAWASSQPSLASIYGVGATAMPRKLADWDAYVTAVVSRYRGRIAWYEVWDTPSDATSWSGPATTLGSDMALLSTHAGAAVHGGDPAALLVSPAFEPDGLRQFLSAGGGASIDALGASLSLAGRAPETVVSAVAAIRGAMANTSAATKPLWNDQPSWTLPASGLSETDQAAYVARSLVLNASLGVSRLAWYAWDENVDTTLRLTDSQGQQTEAATAYGVMEGWLSGAAINGCSASAEQVWSCQVMRNGKAGWILWSATGVVQTSGLGMMLVTDLHGVQEAIDQSGVLSVGSSPVLLQ